MASLDNFIDRTQQERDALNYVLRDQGRSVAVFRRGSQAGIAGLTAASAEPEHISTIFVRFDSFRSRRTTQSEGARTVLTPTALVASTDVLEDDLWRSTDLRNHIVWYRVTSVERTQGSCRVMLEEVKR